MTKEQIDKIFTKKITKYLGKGYIINTQTLGDVDGTLKVDLRKDRQFIRIYLKREYTPNGSTLSLCVGETLLKDNVTDIEIIWEKDLKVLKESVFYEVEKNKWYVTEKEGLNIIQKRKERLKDRNYIFPHFVNSGSEMFANQERAKEIVLPYLKRQYGHSRMKLTDISNVGRVFWKSGNVEFKIIAKGKTFTLH